MFIVHVSIEVCASTIPHVEVFFDNLSTVYEEYSSPKSV